MKSAFFFCRFCFISSQIQLFTKSNWLQFCLFTFYTNLTLRAFLSNTFRQQVLFCTYLHLSSWLQVAKICSTAYHSIPRSCPETLKRSTQYFWVRNKFHSILPTLLASSSAFLGGGLVCFCNGARVVPSISNPPRNVPPQTKTLFFLTQNQNFSQTTVNFAIFSF